ncbi:formate/nitrite transporter [Paenibacillus amylolyticus]|uniref:Formate/nitrite transporter n=1 Tax=Paenibacillus amylolyticus TaxID=1451 RepID=A0A100VSB7_PAEAM|nr:formate/nitrite transporter [Paenibacillus amylolyticus]
MSSVLNHLGTISFQGGILNLVPVTLGNLVGGVLLMGFMYYAVNKPFLDEETH